jgi:hypothetical protein
MVPSETETTFPKAKITRMAMMNSAIGGNLTGAIRRTCTSTMMAPRGQPVLNRNDNEVQVRTAIGSRADVQAVKDVSDHNFSRDTFPAQSRRFILNNWSAFFIMNHVHTLAHAS